MVTITAVAAALVVGTVLATWQAVRASAQRDRALAAEAKAQVEKEHTKATLDFLWEDVLSQASPWEVADRDLKVRTLIDRAADQLEAGTGRPPLVEATLRRMMAQLYSELGEIHKSRRYLEKALEVQRRELAEDDPQLLKTNHFLGRRLCIWNHYDEAEPILSRTLELLRRVQGNEHTETLAVMRWTGFCYSAQGRYAEGEQLFREALDTLSRLPGNHEREKVMHRYYLGLSLATRGNLEAAEAVLTHCLEEWRKRGDRDDFPPALAVLRTLAWVHVVRDDAARAEPLAVEALKRTRLVMGNHHLFVLNSLRVLARIRQMQGRYPEAAELIAQAEEEARRIQEEDKTRLASVLGMRGLNLVVEKKYAAAELPLRECLALWEKRLPHGGEFWFLLSRRGAAREHAFATSLLGAALLGRKNYVEAAPLLVQGYEGLKPQPGFAEDVTPLAQRCRVEALGWLVQLYDEWGKPDEAAKWRKELEATKEAAK
jgi:tetratricopeptide (TPR) repeat protein